MVFCTWIIIFAISHAELCDKGSLFEYIHDDNNPLDLSLAIELTKGIISGNVYSVCTICTL